MERVKSQSNGIERFCNNLWLVGKCSYGLFILKCIP